VNKPIRKTRILGPYLSNTPPPTIAKTLLSSIDTEKMPEVTPRVRENSFSIDLTNTPKEKRMPRAMTDMMRPAAAIHHP
jgi:hypothetical protein